MPVQPPDTLSHESIRPVGPATGLLSVPGDTHSPVTVIANNAIKPTLDPGCLQQAINCRLAPGVTDVVLNPDAHFGYGAPIGCVMASPSHIYPGPVGVDIKCSMSLLQTDLPDDAIADRKTRRAIIDAIVERIPTGVGRGRRNSSKTRSVSFELGRRAVVEGASPNVLAQLGIPTDWAQRCEDSHHLGHDGSSAALEARFDRLVPTSGSGHKRFLSQAEQLGSYGGGNHFGECQSVVIPPDQLARDTAEAFGLRHHHAAFLSHCGSRGWGAQLAQGQFESLRQGFERTATPLPGNDRHMVYAPLGSTEANDYLDDMALGANFATVNHLLINTLVLEAFQQIFPGCSGRLVYFISHNIARKEVWNGQPTWVHRKGATRAFPAGHHALSDTPFSNTGHPILLPGNPRDGSVVMVAEPGAQKSCYSVNHGAGRAMSRTRAAKTLNQATVDSDLLARDVLTNCRQYPIDEAPDAYKDFNAVLSSVKEAGLAREVARLNARFVIKDSDKADD